jgi:serine protease Do
MKRFMQGTRAKWMLVAGIMILIGLPAFLVCESQPKGIEVQVMPAAKRQINTLADLNQAFMDIVSEVKPTVVTVSTERVIKVGPSPFMSDPFFQFFFGPNEGQGQGREQKYHQEGLGSGVIVNADGDIMTNNHVVDNADSIFVRTYDGKRYLAKVVGVDPKTDIAVIKIDAGQLPFIAIGNSDELKAGEMVLAIGSPMSERLAYTVTQGIVSATGRSNVGLADYEDFIQTDAAINPGNSGGPLINLNGELVGINTAIISQSGGSQGIGLAVPSNMAVHVMDSLLKEGKVVRGWLGVSIQDVNDKIAKAMGLKSAQGALIGQVLDDSPGAKAGLKAGDVVVGFNDHAIKDASQLRNDVASSQPGDRVTLAIVRDNQKRTIEATLGELTPEKTAMANPDELQQLLGFKAETLTKELAEKYSTSTKLAGVIVTGIDQNSPAYQAGLRTGDVILSVDREQVQTIQKFAALMAKKKKGETVLLHVNRQGGGFFLVFPLG